MRSNSFDTLLFYWLRTIESNRETMKTVEFLLFDCLSYIMIKNL